MLFPIQIQQRKKDGGENVEALVMNYFSLQRVLSACMGYTMLIHGFWEVLALLEFMFTVLMVWSALFGICIFYSILGYH